MLHLNNTNDKQIQIRKNIFLSGHCYDLELYVAWYLQLIPLLMKKNAVGQQSGIWKQILKW
jgi:hypothetical protein